MTPKKRQGEELETDITFIKTPPQPPAKFATGEGCGVTTTNVSLQPWPPSHQPLRLWRCCCWAWGLIDIN